MVFGEVIQKQLTYKEITKGIPYEQQNALTIGPFHVQFLMTNHPVPCFAMRFEADGKSIVYSADTSFREELISFSNEADLLLCECNFYSDQDGRTAGHMNSIDAGTLAHSAKVKKLILTHLPHYGNLSKLPEEASNIYSGPVSLAKYGETIIV